MVRKNAVLCDKSTGSAMLRPWIGCVTVDALAWSQYSCSMHALTYVDIQALPGVTKLSLLISSLHAVWVYGQACADVFRYGYHLNQVEALPFDFDALPFALPFDFDALAFAFMQIAESGAHPVVAVKTARVGDFNGKTLSTLSTSLVDVDPDVPEAGLLRNWSVLAVLYTKQVG